MKTKKTYSRPLNSWEKDIANAIHHWVTNMTEHDREFSRKSWQTPAYSKRLLDPEKCIFTKCMLQLKSE